MSYTNERFIIIFLPFYPRTNSHRGRNSNEHPGRRRVRTCPSPCKLTVGKKMLSFHNDGRCNPGNLLVGSSWTRLPRYLEWCHRCGRWFHRSRGQYWSKQLRQRIPIQPKLLVLRWTWKLRRTAGRSSGCCLGRRWCHSCRFWLQLGRQ